jgi:hypothetical protein
MKALVLLLASVPALAHADSLTVEAGVGLGEQLGVTSPTAAIGVGEWIAPRVALTARVAALTLSPQPMDQTGVVRIDSFRRTFAFAGPSLQYWFDDHFWFGAGLGFSTMIAAGQDLRGAGADMRIGYAIGAFDLSLEVMPSYFPSGGGFDPVTAMPTAAMTTGVAMLAGYQFR